MSVQSLSFGQKMPGSGSQYLQLKQKGDKVQFRIAQDPVYQGKHFFQTPDGWDVRECPRVATGDDCEWCVEFFKKKAKMKKLLAGRKKEQLSPEEQKAYSDLDKEAQKYAASISFYFAILDRGDESFKILQVTNGVRNKLNAQFEAGVDVMDTEWILHNTGETGVNKYALAAVDSKKANPFTEKEEEAWAAACEFDLSTIAQGGSSDEE